MPELEIVKLAEHGLGRSKNEPLSIWYGQPRLQISDQPPFAPIPGHEPSGLQLLRSILQHPDFLESRARPAVVALPEFALPFSDVVAARDLIANAPKGTLVVFGVGQMTEAEALSIENKPDLWEGSANTRFANCAAIGVGGLNKLFLQPKLLPSVLEQDSHWPGRIVRCFEGDYLLFSVFICSDLLNRPGNSSYMQWLHDRLEQRTRQLTFSLWLQHNEKPRSAHFSNALAEIGKMSRTTVVVVGSTPGQPSRRYENFAVSGAFANKKVFPSMFRGFTHQFHYAEHASADLARVVLLRYDADAYRVRTVLSDALEEGDRVAKGEFFPQSQPYMFSGGALTASSENLHIRQLCEPARQAVEAANPTLQAQLDIVAEKFLQLGTRNFLEFLDVGVVPRTPGGETPHVAGANHKNGDLRCRCWKHRECIDLLCESTGVRPLEAIFETLAILEAAGHAPTPRRNHVENSNIEITLDGAKRRVIVVHPLDFSIDSLPRKLFPNRPPTLNKRFLFVADPIRDRPSVDLVNVAEGPAVGAVDPAKAAPPLIDVLHARDLKVAADAGTLSGLLGRRFGGV